ncbi:unnamed protein product [Sphagnum troendelagicum]
MARLMHVEAAKVIAWTFLLLALFLGVWQVQARVSQHVHFGNFSGFDGTVNCTAQASRLVKDGQTFSIPYTDPNLACSVTSHHNHDGSSSERRSRTVSFVLSQELPGTFKSGLSVLVNIDPRFVLITLEGTDVYSTLYLDSSSGNQKLDQFLALQQF